MRNKILKYILKNNSLSADFLQQYLNLIMDKKGR